MQSKITLIVLLLPTLLIAQFGPGGVGNSTSNGLWLSADAISGLENGDPVVSWPDQSGNNNFAYNNTVNEQPSYKASSPINSRPSVYFDGNLDQMIVDNNHTILDGTSGITYYTVIRPDNLDAKPRGILGKRSSNNTASDYSYIFSFYQTSNNNLNFIYN